jgi:hypothetical protein
VRLQLRRTLGGVRHLRKGRRQYAQRPSGLKINWDETLSPAPGLEPIRVSSML